MGKLSDVRPVAASLYFIPIQTRLPLKFGAETVTSVTCARTRITARSRDGREAYGWGETPLSVTWVWPSAASYEDRHNALKSFCEILAKAWSRFDVIGHPMEIGAAFIHGELPKLLDQFNHQREADQRMPWLAALVCCSLFDIAVHDAYGILNERPVYETYTAEFMNDDLSAYLCPAPDRHRDIDFKGTFPADYLTPRKDRLAAWHLVGGKDWLSDAERDGSEPDDGYPVTLPEWIERDGLTCLKIKLRGNDAAWDYERLLAVGAIAQRQGVPWLTTDFNCTVTDPAYVNDMLDRLMADDPRTYGMILYIEQPFPYDLETNRIDARSVSARKPLFMDESAHDWHLIELGRSLGWTGVALKTCKTQTGALLSLCWAKAHGMTLMVQDLTNPMLAQIPHVQLAAHAGTIMGVETNAMQFYPDASKPEAAAHPGVYRRTNGQLDLSTVRGPGFGYNLEAIRRNLPAPAIGE